MAIDDRLTDQVRAALARVPEISEVKMFGGVAFMLRGNMLVGASDRGLLARVGPPGESAALARGGASPMIMRGRAMPGYMRVAPARLDGPTVRWWVQLARAFVETLPEKIARRRPPPRGAAKTASSRPPAARRKARPSSKATSPARSSR